MANPKTRRSRLARLSDYVRKNSEAVFKALGDRADPRSRRDPARPGNGNTLVRFSAPSVKRVGALVDEEFHRNLRGQKAAKTYTEMGDNSPGIASSLFLLNGLVGQIPWHFEPAKDGGTEAKELADWFEGARTDLRRPWTKVILEILSAVQYGHSEAEVMYKIRAGDNPSKQLHSAYSDRLWGWMDFIPIGQETVWGWDWAGDGQVVGLYQRPPLGRERYVPLRKLIHFAIQGRNDNPEGKSLMRGSYRPYHLRGIVEQFETVGVERGLNGYPYADVPPDYLSDNADEEETSMVEALLDMVTRIGQDELKGMVKPAKVFQGEETGFDVGVILTGADVSKADPIVRRHMRDELIPFLTQFLLLGTEGVGSHALHSSSTSLISMALGVIAGGMQETFQEQAVKPLGRLNLFDSRILPSLHHGDIEKIDFDALGSFIEKMVNAGIIKPQESDEDWAREFGTMPPKAEDGAAETADDLTGELSERQQTSLRKALMKLARKVGVVDF